MGFFKKLLKGAAKVGKVVARQALSTATGGLSEKAIALGKGFGTIIKGKKAGRALQKIPRPQIQALITKTNPGIARGATTMPGGAPLRGIASGSRRKAKRRRSKVRLPQAAFVAAGRPSASKQALRKGRRAAPSGGLNLKAISAAWNAAGKPGTWQSFIKANASLGR